MEDCLFSGAVECARRCRWHTILQGIELSGCICTVCAEICDGFVRMAAAVGLIVFHFVIIIEDCDGRMIKNHKNIKNFTSIGT